MHGCSGSSHRGGGAAACAPEARAPEARAPSAAPLRCDADGRALQLVAVDGKDLGLVVWRVA